MLSRFFQFTLLLLFAGMLGSGQTAADDGKPRLDADGIRFYETQIRPLLAQHCYACHGEKKQESSLRLDTWEGLRTGGKSGAVMSAGQPAQSLLLTAVRYGDPDLQMPPEKRLTKQQIARLEQWIRMGAPHPDAGDMPVAVKKKRISPAAGRRFWSFRKPVRPSIPVVQTSAWVKSDIDRFVLRKLEENGLQPAPPADRRTLIRRTTQSVIGLPPTAEEVEAFLRDDSADAFEKVVDRLLASPHYGERWGRHWLDAAGYVDSRGTDNDAQIIKVSEGMWKYRDYVVAAFNEDKSYDQFLMVQIAGDERVNWRNAKTFSPEIKN
ncbi:MAG: DUF1549 domain-containing protein, partial [Planctomycetaceae bacterium]